MVLRSVLRNDGVIGTYYRVHMSIDFSIVVTAVSDFLRSNCSGLQLHFREGGGKRRHSCMILYVDLYVLSGWSETISTTEFFSRYFNEVRFDIRRAVHYNILRGWCVWVRARFLCLFVGLSRQLSRGRLVGGVLLTSWCIVWLCFLCIGSGRCQGYI